MNLDAVISDRICGVMGNESLSDDSKSRMMKVVETTITDAYMVGDTTYKPIHLLTCDDLFNVNELKRLCFPEDIGCEEAELIW